MKPVILDSDIPSEFLKGNLQVKLKLDEQLNEFGFISLSVITHYEILSGLLYKDARKQLERFNEFVKMNKVIPLTIKATKIAAPIQADLRKNGTLIGHTDILIAGTAIAHGFQLITNNTVHFKRIKGMEIDNWKK